MVKSIICGCLLVLSVSFSGFPGVMGQNKTDIAGSIKKVEQLLGKEVLQRADKNLKEKPVTVTAAISDRSAGGIHDFYSEGDYWWPDPASPDSPYIRKDGLTNPDNFVAHRQAMIRFSKIVGNLAPWPGGSPINRFISARPWSTAKPGLWIQPPGCILIYYMRRR